MIIVKIKAGLGNQLFQYACGRALAIRNNDILKLDTTIWTDNIPTEDPYGLNHFNIVENIASQEEIDRLEFPRGDISRFYFKLRTKLRLFNAGFVPRVLKKKGDQYLNGYWQSEKYFTDFADIIREDFTLKDPLGPSAKMISDKIAGCGTSISVHIRRGAITKQGPTHPFWGICTPKYCLDGLNYIAGKIKGDFRVFVFSEDIDVVKKEISIPYPVTYVPSDKTRDYEEIILMSMCDHNVIANSTFSWWGAWLNNNPDKIVVAPKIWARRNNFTFRNIIPPSWIRL